MGINKNIRASSSSKQCLEDTVKISLSASIIPNAIVFSKQIIFPI